MSAPILIKQRYLELQQEQVNSPSKQGEDVAWMGYVGALAGLVIGLLLMISVVGIGISLMGRSALVVKPEAPVINFSAPTPVSSTLAEQEPVTGQPTQSQLPQPVRPKILLALRFEVGNVSVTETYLKTITDKLNSKTKAIETDEWLLMTTTDPRYAEQQRQGFLRLLVIRNILLEMGVPASRIRSQMVSPAELPSSQSHVVYIARPAQAQE